jgi:phosphoglucosamine mutase
MSRLFGTDGVRGVANTELTPETALQLGRAGAYVLTRSASRVPRVLIGKDTRRSGDMLEAALIAGLCSLGAEVYSAGVFPTPGVAYLTQKYQMDAGVMISASHNPMQDNGIKFFSADGCKLPDALEDEIEKWVNKNTALPRPQGADVGVVKPCPDALTDYADFLISTVPGLSLEGMTIALDCANGATSVIAPGIFTRLGAKVCVANAAPDGTNINKGCGSTHIGPMQRFTVDNHCDIAFAYDGDGDRLICVDERGHIVEGDEVLAICGLDLRRRGLLTHNTLVSTIMGNLGLSIMCQKQGITLLQTAVGDRYVLEKMREGDYALGGEQSGHIIFRRYNNTGDGMLTSLQLLHVLKREGKTLSAAKTVMTVLPQVLLGARAANRQKAAVMENESVRALIAQTERELGREGRLLVRPSGTEPLIRVMVEAKDTGAAEKYAKALTALIEKTAEAV